jgi:hypothetical protein
LYIAKEVYKKKTNSLTEPQLTDYCNDFIDYLVNKRSDLSTVNEVIIDADIVAFDDTGLYSKDNKTYIERGIKLVDIIGGCIIIFYDFINRKSSHFIIYLYSTFNLLFPLLF